MFYSQRTAYISELPEFSAKPGPTAKVGLRNSIVMPDEIPTTEIQMCSIAKLEGDGRTFAAIGRDRLKMAS
jgi:hypothetical protein